MQSIYFTYGLLAALAIALLIAAFTDLKSRKIDNRLNLAIALGAPLFWWASGLSLIEIGYQFAVAVGAFIILAALFAIRAMGGGDVKLLTALALWIKPIWFLKLIVLMSLLGGVLTLIFGAWHLMLRRTNRLAIPYGVAISTAGLWIIGAHYLPALQTAAQAG